MCIRDSTEIGAEVEAEEISAPTEKGGNRRGKWGSNWADSSGASADDHLSQDLFLTGSEQHRFEQEWSQQSEIGEGEKRSESAKKGAEEGKREAEPKKQPGADAAPSAQTKKNPDMCLTNSQVCLLYTSPSPRDLSTSRMPSSA